MRDPVTGFEYPDAWVQRCHNAGLLLLVETGLAVLTSSGTVLRRGFTTGTTAAAACAAAARSLEKDVDSVVLRIPCGIIVNVRVKGRAGIASSTKFSGDYPGDVTAGIEFVARAEPAQEGIRIEFGEGIGRFVRNTPRFKAGTPAVSPPALDCIRDAIQDALGSTGLPGITVYLSVPEGAAIAKKTLNPRIGVECGISVLGTTGLVEPWDDHLTESTLERIAQADRPVLTTGRTGLRYARLMYPDREVILIGGKIECALSAVRGGAILFGLPALILRYINPRILEGTGAGTVEELAVTPLFPSIVQENLAAFGRRYPAIRVVLVDRNGQIIGESA
jgi:cobalt-precorrin-5B (C1)-methyltransferase